MSKVNLRCRISVDEFDYTQYVWVFDCSNPFDNSILRTNDELDLNMVIFEKLEKGWKLGKSQNGYKNLGLYRPKNVFEKFQDLFRNKS